MLRFFRDPQTKEFLIAGTGQQHIEVIVSKLKNRYHTEVNPEGAEGSLSRNHSRARRRAGPSQEAERRPRPVRRLQDQDGAFAPRRQLRVRQRNLRRRHPQELHSCGRERHRGSGPARTFSPASPWWTSRLSCTTAPITMSTPTSFLSRPPAASPSAKPWSRPSPPCWSRS